MRDYEKNTAKLDKHPTEVGREERRSFAHCARHCASTLRRSQLCEMGTGETGASETSVARTFEVRCW